MRTAPSSVRDLSYSLAAFSSSSVWRAVEPRSYDVALRPRPSYVNISITDIMDSQVQVEGRLLDIVTDDWRKEKLPLDDIAVPLAELPDPEADNGQTESLRQQENKWSDLALQSVQDTQQPPSST